MKDQDNTYNKQPDYIAYNVQQSRNGKGHWTRIGAAWQHKDGKGYDIDMSCTPVDGRVTLREMRDQRQQEHNGNQQPAHEHPQEMRNEQSRER